MTSCIFDKDLQELYVDGASAGHLEGIRGHDYNGVCNYQCLDRGRPAKRFALANFN